MATRAQVPTRQTMRSRKKDLQGLRTLLENKSDMLLSDIVLDGTVISTGTFSVKSATFYDTEDVVAKTLRDDYCSVERFVMECKFVLYILGKNSHPNILRMYGFAYCNGDCPHLITEYMSKPLSQHILESKYYKKDDRYSELKLHIVRDIANGLNSEYFHWHSPAYIHCGLTCNNILLTEGNRAKISNFSRIKLENEDLPDFESCNELRSYLPPEVLHRQSNVSRKCVDMYAFAKVMYYIATDTIPSVEVPETEYNEELITKARTRDDNHHRLSTIAVDRIINKVDPESRMAADEVFRELHDVVAVVRPSHFNLKLTAKSNILSSMDEHQYTSGESDSNRAFKIPQYLQRRIPTDDQLVRIAYRYVHDWETLGNALGLNDTEVKEINDSEQYKIPKAKKLAMLRMWHQKFHPKDTVERLLNGFFEVSRNDDARKVLHMLESDYRKFGYYESDNSSTRLEPVFESSQDASKPLKDTVTSPSDTPFDNTDVHHRDVDHYSSTHGQGQNPEQSSAEIDILSQPGSQSNAHASEEGRSIEIKSTELPSQSLSQGSHDEQNLDPPHQEVQRNGLLTRLSNMMKIPTARRLLYEQMHYSVSDTEQEP